MSDIENETVLNSKTSMLHEVDRLQTEIISYVEKSMRGSLLANDSYVIEV